MKDENHVDPFDKIRFMNRIAKLESQATAYQAKEKAQTNHIKILNDRFKVLSGGLTRITQVKPDAGRRFCNSLLKYLPVDVQAEVQEIFERKQIQEAVAMSLREYGAELVAKDLKI